MLSNFVIELRFNAFNFDKNESFTPHQKAYNDLKIDLSSVDAYGRNIVHIACMHNNDEFLAQLIELKVFDLNQPNLAIDSKETDFNNFHSVGETFLI